MCAWPLGRAPGQTRLNYTVEISPHGGTLPPTLTARLHTGVSALTAPTSDAAHTQGPCMPGGVIKKPA